MAKRRGNNEGSISKRNNGTYRVQVSVGGRRLSFTASTRRECQEWLIKALHQNSRRNMLIYTDKAVGEYFNGWLMNRKSSYRRSTWVGYEQAIRLYINPHLGEQLVCAVTPEQIQSFYNALLGKGVGIPTILKVHMVLHAGFRQAVRLMMIERNPVDYCQPPKVVTREMAVLNESEVSLFLVAIAGHRLETLFQLALVTGMRQMELLGLRWSDINWAKQTLKVERQLVRPNGGVVEFSAPKTRFGKRTIPVGGQTIAALQNHHARQQIERKAAGSEWREHDLIFTNPLGGPIDHSRLVKDFKRILSEAGLPVIRFHDLRHTAASIMLNSGISAIVVSRRLGHAKTSITTDIYGHLIPGIQPDVGDIIDELILPKQLHQLHPVFVNIGPENAETGTYSG